MDTPPVILFDGVCNLCNGAVTFVLRRDRAGVFRFAPLQSRAARRLLGGEPAPSLDTMILVENGSVYRRSGAALRVARRLGALWPLLYAFIVVPRPLRDAAYNWIARNRYRWFGKRDACMVPEPGVRDRFLD